MQPGACKATGDRLPAAPEEPLPGNPAGDRRDGYRTGQTYSPGSAAGHQCRGSHGAGKVLREKKERKSPAVAKPQEPTPSRPAIPVPSTAAAAAKPSSKTRAKGRKGDAIQRFVSTRIVREAEESPDAIVAKDELYQRFERWCRDQDYDTIPERRVFSVALKNKYAFAERTVGGTASWVSIRIK